MSHALQEVIALGIVGLAVLYVCARLTGWPRLVARRTRAAACCTPTEEPASRGVVLGARLRRGLRARERSA